MYLASIEIENFRIFGDRQSGSHFQLELNPGINLIVGANDSGKSCLIDAVRILLGTSTSDYNSVEEDDFHIKNGVRAKELKILGTFQSLDDAEAASLLEHVGIETVGGRLQFSLRIWLTATLEDSPRLGARKRRVQVDVRAGTDAEGQRIDARARELLHAAYLRPLRDAVGELAAKRNSRLSQLLRAYKEIEGQEKSDWDETKEHDPKTLVGVMRKAEHALRANPVIQSAENDLNERYLGEFSLGDAVLRSRITPSPHELQNILEKLELGLTDGPSRVLRGLGIQNLLFVAAELLALGKGDEPELPMVLIEEPEAHLEPQRQIRLIEYLRARAKKRPSSPATELQLLLSTHSPNLASHVSVQNLILLHQGRAFSLAPRFTALTRSDYEFLDRFLDVTKANLFFARGVVMVEGDSEALLLPTLAELLGYCFRKYGVSVVNVGHVGFFRYSRIFQRTSGAEIPIRVACIADRDIPPDEAKPLLPANRKTECELGSEGITKKISRKKRYDGGPVRTFVSEVWTFEHDLVIAGLGEYVHVAACLAAKQDVQTSDFRNTVRSARKEFFEWSQQMSEKELACRVFETFLKDDGPSKAITAQWLARLLKRRCPQDLHKRLPPYLLSSIRYVTVGESGDESS